MLRVGYWNVIKHRVVKQARPGRDHLYGPLGKWHAWRIVYSPMPFLPLSALCELIYSRLECELEEGAKKKLKKSP